MNHILSDSLTVYPYQDSPIELFAAARAAKKVIAIFSLTYTSLMCPCGETLTLSDDCLQREEKIQLWNDTHINHSTGSMIINSYTGEICLWPSRDSSNP